MRRVDEPAHVVQIEHDMHAERPYFFRRRQQIGTITVIMPAADAARTPL